MSHHLLRLSRGILPLKAVAPPPLTTVARTYISDMRQSAFKENLLRLLRAEITYETDSRPPRSPPLCFDSYSIENRLGEQWIRLRRQLATEEIKIDATMFDGAVPVPSKKTSPAAGGATDARLHISLIVEVSKGKDDDCLLNFICSAWPDALDIEKIYPARRGPSPIKPYMGPDFREMDDELQSAAREYLEERGVDDDMAEFLHEYMANKDRAELVSWLKNVKSYVIR